MQLSVCVICLHIMKVVGLLTQVIGLHVSEPDNDLLTMALKGAFRNFLQPLYCAVRCFQHVCFRGQGAIVCKSCVSTRADHLQMPIPCNVSCAAWYEVTAQLLSLTVEIAYISV